MPLIDSPRITKADRAVWDMRWAMDLRLASARASRMDQLERRAMDEVRAFLERGKAYVSVSWGKDSVVTAHLALRADPALTLVYAREDPFYSPECLLVRDDFLSAHPDALYDEMTCDVPLDLSRECGWAWDPSIVCGDRGMAAEHGPRYICGIRAQESRDRTLRMAVHGHSSRNSCAPIGWWSMTDVFCYLARYDLPVHPAYAMSMGGRMNRDAIRVAPLTGPRGTGRGRSEWEKAYYQDHIDKLRLQAEASR